MSKYTSKKLHIWSQIPQLGVRAKKKKKKSPHTLIRTVIPACANQTRERNFGHGWPGTCGLPSSQSRSAAKSVVRGSSARADNFSQSKYETEVRRWEQSGTRTLRQPIIFQSETCRHGWTATPKQSSKKKTKKKNRAGAIGWIYSTDFFSFLPQKRPIPSDLFI